MIKDFIANLEDKAMKAVLAAMDKRLDQHHKRLEDLEEEYKKLDKIKAIVEDGAETRKLIKKIVLTGLVGGVITYFLTQLGFL